MEGRLPEAWIPPAHVREWRTRARLRKTLVDERTTWPKRVQATLFHHGVSGVPDKLRSAAGREFLQRLELPEATRERIEVALQMIEAIDRQLAPLEQALRRLARRQPGCQALMSQFGIGELTAPTILSELGDVTVQVSRRVSPARSPRPWRVRSGCFDSERTLESSRRLLVPPRGDGPILGPPRRLIDSPPCPA